MESEWYLKVADEEVGPLTPQQLKAMADKGQISPYDPVRLGAGGRWVPASSVRGLLPMGGPSAGQPPRSRLPVAEELAKPPGVPSGKPGAERKPAAETTFAAETQPAAAPAAWPPGTGQSEIPVAPMVPATPAAEASGPSLPGPFAIETGVDDLVARYSGRRHGADAGPRRRRRKEAMIVGAVMALMALAAVTAAVILSGKGVTTASRGPKAADETPRKAKTEHEEVVIPGLDEYLREVGPESADNPASEGSAADPWTDASTSSVECGDVSVKITSAQIARPRSMGRASGGAAHDKKDYLCLKLELRNRNRAKEREYRSWNVEDAGVTLVDDRHKRYSIKSFAQQGLGLDGQVEGGKATLDAEEATEDMLVFEKPAKSAAFLRLKLPARAFGEEGSLKFEIPISMIAVADASQESGLDEASVLAAERATGKRAALKAGSAQAAESEDDGGPIPIPGVTDEPSDEGEDDFSLPDDSKLQQDREEPLRRQEKENRADRGPEPAKR